MTKGRAASLVDDRTRENNNDDDGHTYQFLLNYSVSCYQFNLDIQTVPQSVSSLFSSISLVYVVCYSDNSSVSRLFSSISLVYAVCYCYTLIL